MPLTPSGVVVGLLYLALVGVDARGLFSYRISISTAAHLVTPAS